MFTVICFNEHGDVEVNCANRVGYTRETKSLWFTIQGDRNVYTYCNVNKEYAQKAIVTMLKKNGVDLRAFGKYEVSSNRPSVATPNEQKDIKPRNDGGMKKAASAVNDLMGRMAQEISEDTQALASKARKGAAKIKQQQAVRSEARAAEKAEREAAKQAERAAKEQERLRREQESAERAAREEARRSRQAAIAQRERDAIGEREREEDELIDDISEAVAACTQDDPDYMGDIAATVAAVQEDRDEDILNEITRLNLDLDLDDLDDVLDDMM